MCNRCVKHLQKQSPPTGVVIADDEFIIHVEGTATSQRIVRHIGGTSWPGTLSFILVSHCYETSHFKDCIVERYFCF